MSAAEQQTESRSSVKVSLNAKGDAQVEVKAYVGDSDDDHAEARDRALWIFETTLDTLKQKGYRP